MTAKMPTSVMTVSASPQSVDTKGAAPGVRRIIVKATMSTPTGQRTGNSIVVPIRAAKAKRAHYYISLVTISIFTRRYWLFQIPAVADV